MKKTLFIILASLCFALLIGCTPVQPVDPTKPNDDTQKPNGDTSKIEEVVLSVGNVDEIVLVGSKIDVSKITYEATQGEQVVTDVLHSVKLNGVSLSPDAEGYYEINKAGKVEITLTAKGSNNKTASKTIEIKSYETLGAPAIFAEVAQEGVQKKDGLFGFTYEITAGSIDLPITASNYALYGKMSLLIKADGQAKLANGAEIPQEWTEINELSVEGILGNLSEVQKVSLTFEKANGVKVYLKQVCFYDLMALDIDILDYEERKVGETYHVIDGYVVLPNGDKIIAEKQITFNNQEIENSVVTFSEVGELKIKYTIKKEKHILLNEDIVKECIVKVIE